jgi:O-antigen/teichoic acid export membrane protein
MFKQLVSTYKESLIYSLGNLSNKVVGFILLPLYTSYISISDFGILGLIEPTTQIIFTLLSLGLNSAYMRWYAIEKEDKRRQNIFFNINFTLFINTTIFVLLLVYFAADISYLIFSTYDYKFILQIAFINIFFLVINPIIFSTLRIQHKAIQFSVVRTIQFSLNLLLNIYLIVYLEWGLLSIFISQLVSQFLVFLYFIPNYYRLSRFQIKYDLIREFLKFSLPLIPVGFFQLIITMVNRFFLDHYDTLESVGIFSFAYRISNTVKILVIESISLSLTPILYQKLSEPKGARFVQKNFLYATFAVLFVYIFVASFSREIILLIAQDSSYYLAYHLIPLLTFAYVFQVMIYFYQVLLSHSKKTSKILNATIITAIGTIGINFLLIPQFKIYGAAVANVVSSIILLLCISYFARMEWKSFFETKKIYVMIICAVSIVIFNLIILPQSGYLISIFKIFICLSFPILLYPFNFYEKVEIERISQMLSSIRKKLGNKN